MFLIFTNDLTENLPSNPEHFSSGTSLFPVVRDLITSANEINDNLEKIGEFAHQWKMSFNPNPLKQAQEVFLRKRIKTHRPDFIFNLNPVKKILIKNIWVCFLIVNLILMNILKECLIRLVNLLVLFTSSEIFEQDHLFY